MTTSGSLLCRSGKDVRLFVPPDRPYSLTLQFPVLSGPPFELSPATVLDVVQCLLGQNAFGHSRCISQTTLQHPQDFGLEVGPEFPRIVGIVRFPETFRKFPFEVLSNARVAKPTDIQPNSVGWHHLTRLEPYFQGSHEKSVVGPGVPKEPAVLDNSPATAYNYMFDFSPCTTAIRIPIPIGELFARYT